MCLFLVKRIFSYLQLGSGSIESSFPKSSKTQVKFNILFLNPIGSFTLMPRWRWISGPPRCRRTAALYKEKTLFTNAPFCLAGPFIVKWKLIIFLIVILSFLFQLVLFKIYPHRHTAGCRVKRFPSRKVPRSPTF